ncbi:MAG: MG2 domain-containing protein, partial [Planctomycetales bacterium]
MFTTPLTRRTFVTGMLCVGAGAASRLMSDDRADESKSKGSPGLPGSDALGGAERYLTFVSTDKPLYRAGETLFVRGVVLHHATRKPLPDNLAIQAAVQIIGSQGDAVASGVVATEEGVIGFSWLVPERMSGGEYSAKITFPQHGHTPAERRFDIREYRAPRLKTQIKFLRDGYGAGDEVVATIHVERAEGGTPVDARLTVTARVDDAEAYRGSATLDHEGNGAIRFPLPPTMTRGEGTLAIVIDDSGAAETASKTIPILLQTVDLALYPEGGELIAGLLNRVYFEARTPAKKPADLAGIVIDDERREVARFQSEHEGRGRFEFTPQAGRSYLLTITEPSGIPTEFPLPLVKPEGAVIRATRNTFRKREPIRLEIAATSGKLVATLAQRETILDRQLVPQGVGRSQTVTFEVPPEVAGVLTVTVWNEAGAPLAERLVFRQPSHTVRVTLAPDAKTYSPGGKAAVKVKTLDERGRPVSAVVGLTVTDDSVLELIDQRDQTPRLPAMVYLENEVRELADARVYLDAQNPHSELAIDLLLGTQGWRRFALVDWKEFVERHQDSARRVLALLEPACQPLASELWEDRFVLFARSAVESGPVDALQLGNDKSSSVEKSKRGERLVREGIPQRRDAGRQLAVPVGERRRRLGAILAQKELGDFRLEAAADKSLRPANDFVYTRVYAHDLHPNRQPGDRTDFTETLFWHAGLKTNEQGEASIEFALNDAVTTFRVLADAFTGSGALGSGTTLLESVNPFYLEPKLPLEVTQGDRILLPVVSVNTTSSALDQVTFSVEARFADNSVDDQTLSLSAASRQRRLVDLSVGRHNGRFDVTIAATAGAYRDRVTRPITVRPAGFPMEITGGGLLDQAAPARHEFVIPPDLVAASLETQVEVFPSPLASMTGALQALIREPNGCFEQTSATVYPLVMAQQYFLSHHGVPVALIEQSAEILNRGYDRLRQFECKSGGFEWFGADPGHDALTAYGLLEFTEMNAVRPVDPDLLERTRVWLLAQRDGHGTFQRQTHTLHTWLAEPEVATTYNVWALLSAGVDADLTTEVNWIRTAADRTANTYVLALAANVLRMAGDRNGAASLLDRLAGKQLDTGALAGATVSVVGSTGDALSIETTALAALAWLHDPHYVSHVEKAIQYLAESCQGGRFGST